MNKIHILLCALLLMSVVATAQQKTGMKPYSGDGFSLSYPAGWEINENGNMGAKVMIFSPLESQTDDFRENLNVISENLQGQSMTLEDYVNLSKKNIALLMTNGKIISSKKIRQDNRDMYIIDYSGDQGQFHLKFECLIWFNNGSAYVLTFCAKTTTYAKYLPQASQVISSLRVTQ